MNDSWVSGFSYDKFMGRWSNLVAQDFLSWLAIPPARIWLDVGCGTGSLTRLILETYQPKEIISIDSSSDFISYAQRSIPDRSVHFKVVWPNHWSWIRIPLMPLFLGLCLILFHNPTLQSWK